MTEETEVKGILGRVGSDFWFHSGLVLEDKDDLDLQRKLRLSPQPAKAEEAGKGKNGGRWITLKGGRRVFISSGGWGGFTSGGGVSGKSEGGGKEVAPKTRKLTPEESQKVQTQLEAIPEAHRQLVKSVKTGEVAAFTGHRDSVAVSDSNGNIVLDSRRGLADPTHLTHEVGHVVLARSPKVRASEVDRRFKKARRDMGTVKGRSGFVSNYAALDPAEYFAESYAAFVHAPEKLRKEAPDMFDYLERMWKE